MRTSMLAMFLLLAAVVAPVVHAEDISYYVDRGVGPDSWISGYITTNGATGVLTAADLVSDNLWLIDGTGPTVHITGTSADMILAGEDLTATDAALYFDFLGTDAGRFYVGSSSGAHVCFTSEDAGCHEMGAESIGLATLRGNTVESNVNGNGMIGLNLDHVDPATTPEPGSWLLLGTGLLGMAGLAWRRIAA